MLLGGDGGDADVVRPLDAIKPPSANNQDLLDLLGGLDSGIDNTTSTTNSMPQTMMTTNSVPIQNNNNILLNTYNNSTPSYLIDDINTSNRKPVQMMAYNKNSLRITFDVERLNDVPSTTEVSVVANNDSSAPFTEFVFQAAVPKTFQLQMMPPSGTVIPPNGCVTQVLRVTNSTNSALRMRIRVSFRTSEGTSIQDQAEVNNFPTDPAQ